MGKNSFTGILRGGSHTVSRGLPELPVDKPYEGSAFYVSHAEAKGGD
jgi:hypothetical protein